MDRRQKRFNNNNKFEAKGLHVEVHNNDVSRALRKLKKMVNNDGLLKELRDREYYEKPSLKRKKAKAAARKRWLKQQEKNTNRQLDNQYRMYYISIMIRTATQCAKASSEHDKKYKYRTTGCYEISTWQATVSLPTHK